MTLDLRQLGGFWFFYAVMVQEAFLHFPFLHSCAKLGIIKFNIFKAQVRLSLFTTSLRLALDRGYKTSQRIRS
jgi:hypothetical protein